MPTPDEAAKLFNFPFSPRQRIRRMITIANDIYDLNIKISDRSLDNLSSIGVSEKKLLPISSGIKNRIHGDTLIKIKNIETSILNNKINALWESYLVPFSDGYNSKAGINIDIEPILEFLKSRSDIHISAIKTVDKNDYHTIKNYYSIILEHTLIGKDDVKNIISLIHSQSTNNFLKTDEQERSLLFFYFDFYLFLIAAIDKVICRLVKSDKYPFGIFHTLLECSGNTYFGKSLYRFANHMGLTIYKLSQYIPVTDTNDKSNDSSRRERQFSILKKWRNGKTKPRIKTLDNFYNNFGEGNPDPLILISTICISIDKIIENPEFSESKKVINEIFSSDNYKKYFIALS